MLGIPLGLLTANLTEWVFHKYVLHGIGKNPKSFWSFHWHDHHKASRQHAMLDDQYDAPLRGWNPQTKEAIALVGGVALVTPLAPVAPFFYGTLVYSAVNYYRVHKKSHLDEEWAKENLPWHWDHHMAPNQDANWCVTKPWFDDILGTREVYLDTEDEIASRPRRQKVTDRYREKLRQKQQERRERLAERKGLRRRVTDRLLRREAA